MTDTYTDSAPYYHAFFVEHSQKSCLPFLPASFPLTGDNNNSLSVPHFSLGYDKIHLFKYFGGTENLKVTPGENEPAVVQLDFAKIGLGIACVIRQFVQEELDRGILHEIPLGFPIHAREIGLAFPSSSSQSQALKTFTDFFR